MSNDSGKKFQETLAIFYSGILRFHKEAYISVKRGSKWLLPFYEPRDHLLTGLRLANILPHFMDPFSKTLRLHYR